MLTIALFMLLITALAALALGVVANLSGAPTSRAAPWLDPVVRRLERAVPTIRDGDRGDDPGHAGDDDPARGLDDEAVGS